MATTSLFLRGLMACLACAVITFAPNIGAQQNPVNLQQELSVAAENNQDTQTAFYTNVAAAQRSKLQQELHSLLAENARINQEKIQLLESQSQRVFWTKCLIGFLFVMMLVSMFSFWRLHVQHKFQTGLDSLTTSLRSFQDSIFSLSFIDTSGYSTVGSTSSFQMSQTELDELEKNSGTNSQLNSRLNSQLNSQFNSGLHRTSPNTVARGDEFSDIRGFFDAWLNVYKPGDPRYEEAMAATSKPESAKPWLQMLDNFRQSSDHSGFETIRKEIKKFFNIKINPWEIRAHGEQKQLSDYPHIMQKIVDIWPTDEVIVYLERLLHNSRLNPREGFDITIFQQLESLLELASRPNRPRDLRLLKNIGIADFLFAPANPSEAKISVPASAPKPAKTPAMPAAISAKIPQKIASTASAQTPQTKPSTVVVNHAPAARTTEAPPTITPISHPAPVTLATEDDEKTRFSANEVRLKLAIAYLDIGDTEGACLLLEDVIKVAVPAQQAHAQRLLGDIEKKQARTCGDNERIYFH